MDNNAEAKGTHDGEKGTRADRGGREDGWEEVGDVVPGRERLAERRGPAMRMRRRKGPQEVVRGASRG